MRIVCLVLLASWLVAGGAHAQIAANGAPLEGATLSGTVTVQQTDCDRPPWYFWIDNIGADGSSAIHIDFTCPAEHVLDTTKLADGPHFLHARNDPGKGYTSTFTVRNAAPSPPAVATPPACWPFPKFNFTGEKIPPTVDTRYTFSATWVCDKPTGYRMFTFLWGETARTAERAAKIGKRLMTTSEADALYIAEWGGPPNTSELDYMLARNTAHQPLAVVAMNGATPTRPVYGKNASGTRNSATRAERVAIMQPNGRPTYCWWGRRLIDSNGKGTKYFSVQGAPNIATADPHDVLPEVYTLCDVTSQLGFN